MATKALPKMIYVRWDKPLNGEPYLQPALGPEDLLEFAADEKTIGVYTLKEIVVAKSTITTSVRKK